jgi:hypothetical protein
MPSNFKICVYENKNNMSLKIIGNFDWNLINKLIYLLKKECNSAPKILNGKTIIMPSNFKIYVYENNNNMSLKIIGNFDWNLINKLIYMLKKERNSTPELLINMNMQETFLCPIFMAGSYVKQSSSTG